MFSCRICFLPLALACILSADAGIAATLELQNRKPGSVEQEQAPKSETLPPLKNPNVIPQPTSPSILVPVVPAPDSPQTPTIIVPVIPAPAIPETPPAHIVPDAKEPPLAIVPTPPQPEQPQEPERAKPVAPLTPGSFLPKTETPQAEVKPEMHVPETQTQPKTKPDQKQPAKQQETKPEIKEPKKGDPLRIPDEAKKTGSLDFLEGCWVGTRPEYHTKRIVTEKFCFGKNGVGKRFILDPGVAGQCVGATKALLNQNGVLRMESERMYCTDVDDTWGASQMTCEGEGDQTPCTWIFRDIAGARQSYTIRFVRE